MVNSLRLIGFVVYRGAPGIKELEEADPRPDRYVVRGYPYSPLYGGKGSKEALIVAQEGAYIIEAKYQKGSGSVDEKFPYIWEQFLVSAVSNWIVVVDGPWWQIGRGKRAVEWLRERSHHSPSGRNFWVVDREGFITLALRLWGAKAA